MRWLRKSLSQAVQKSLRLPSPTRKNHLHVQELESRDVPSVSGLVFRDYNANGVLDSREPGVAGVTVTAYDINNNVVGTTTTTTNGTYNLNFATVSNRPLRLEFTNYASYLQPGAQGASAGTDVQFVIDGATGVNFDLNNPLDYAQAASQLTIATQEYVYGNQLTGANANSPVLVSFNYNAAGPANNGGSPYTVLATAKQIGTTWGETYQNTSNTIFVSAFMKSYAGFGPGGPGAIYAVNTVTGQVTLLYTVQNVGTDPHPTDATNDANWFNDVNSFDSVGKVGLGGLQISADGRSLYTVNLNTNQLVVIPITASGAFDGGRSVQTFNIPNPNAALGAARAGDIHAFAVALNDGTIYVGEVDSAQSSQKASDMAAYVYAFNPATNTFNTTPVLNFPLNYNRGDVNVVSGISATWNPWISSWNQSLALNAGNPLFPSYPQAMLTGITFDNGSMVLGFRDRWGDQTGYKVGAPIAGDNTQYSGIAGGDILRASQNLNGNGVPNGTFTIEPLTYPPQTNVTKYYTGANYQNFHDDIAEGGVVQVPGFSDVITSAFDPIQGGSKYTGGVIHLNDTTGVRVAGADYQLYDGSNLAAFGKANGIGDVVALQSPAPIEIGNRVWADTNGDGIQEAGEPGINGITVDLLLNGNVIQTATTSNGGQYYFTGLLPNTNYQVRIDPNQTTLTNDGLTTLTQANVGSATDPNINSKATLVGGLAVINLTTGGPGNNDYSFDVGFTTPPVANVTVKKVADNPTVVAGAQAGYTLTITNTGPATATGVTLSDPLPALGGNNVWAIDPASTNAGSFTITGSAGSQSLTFSSSVSTLAVNTPLVVHVVGTTTPTAAAGFTTTLTNTATVNATNETVHNQTSTATVTVLSPDVTVTKTADAATINGGQTAGFTVTINNIGAGTANGVTLVDALPNLGTGTTWQIDNTIGNPASFVLGGTAGAQTLSLVNGTNLAAAGSLKVHITAVSVPGLAPFTANFPNTATVSATNEATSLQNSTATASVTVLSPDVTVTKTADAAGLTAGQTAGFTVTITNTGLAPAQGVTLSDPLPALGGTNLWSIDTTKGNPAAFQLSGAAGAQTLSLVGTPTLAAGASLTLHITGVTTTSNLTLPNTATVSATNEAPPLQNQKSTATITIGTLSIGDFVWKDLNDNGIQDTNEPGVQGVSVELLSGTTVLQTTTTDANGKYLFTNLSAGTYTVEFVPSTLPAGYVFTKPNATGSTTANDSNANVTTGLTAPITLTNASDLTVDAGLVAVSSLAGNVYVDNNNNGVRDSGEAGIPNTTLTLTGTDDLGNAVSKTTLTASDGTYSFPNLRPGNYTITETQPAGFQNGKDAVGSAGGTLGNDVLSNITLAPGVSGINYNFGEINTTDIAVTQTVSKALVNVGDIVDLTFVVKNNGPLDALNTKMTTPLPTGLVFQNVVSGPGQGTYDPSTGIWNLGTLQNGVSTTLVIAVQVTQSGVFTNTAVVSTSNPETTYVNNVSPITISTIQGASKQQFLSSQPTSPGGSVSNLQPPNPGAPSVASDAIIVTGVASGAAPLIQVFNRATGAPQLSFLAFSSGFLGGVSVALGDVNGDGVADIIVGAGIGGQGHVEVFDGSTGQLIRSFLAFPGFNGAITVASADINGDGHADIIVGAGAGAPGGHVEVFDGASTTSTPAMLASFFAYDQGYLGGVNVAAGALVAGQNPDVITGSAEGATHVKAFSISGGVATQIRSFIAFAGNASGIAVAAGDTTGSGHANIIVSTTSGSSAVGIFDGTTSNLVRSFTAFPGTNAGAFVAAADANGDGKADVIVSGGPGSTSQVKVFDGPTGSLLDSFLAYNSSFTGGATVAGVRQV